MFKLSVHFTSRLACVEAKGRRLARQFRLPLAHVRHSLAPTRAKLSESQLRCARLDRSFYLSCLAGGLLLVALPSHSVDKSRLWLAISDQKYYLRLIQAAEAAESLARCTEVVEATLDSGQSRPGHPIFRILCLQPSGRSYNEMVDGLSFETLTTPKPVVVELTPEEQQRLVELERLRELKAIEDRKDKLWQSCERALIEKTRMMIDIEWLQKDRPELDHFDDEGARFSSHFNARSLMGEPLRYTAVCDVTDEEVKSVSLGRRAD